MNSPSPKVLAVISVGAWVATGALAFWAGRESGAKLSNSKDAGKIAKVAGMLDQASRDNKAPVTLESLLKSPGAPDALALARWVSGLSPKDCASAIAALQQLPAGIQRDTILNAVVDAWAHTDPKGFLAASGSITGPATRENGVEAALHAWATTDPKAALDWLKQNPGAASNYAMQQRYAAVIAGFAATDPQGAFNAVNSLPSATRQDAQLKQQALQGLVTGMANAGRFTDAVALFNQIGDGQTRNQAYTMLLGRWASASPTDAATWVATLTDPQQRTAYNAQIATAWAQSDPAAAVAWAVQADAANPDPNANSAVGFGRRGNNNNLLADAIRTWSNYDLDGPAQYLNNMPASPDKDQAVATFVQAAGREDPAGAMTWADTITNPQLHQQAEMQVAMQWARQDPNALLNYVNTDTSLSDADKQMLTNIAQNGGRGGFAGGRGGFGGGGGGFAGGGGGFGGGGGGGGNFGGNGGGGYAAATDTTGTGGNAVDANGNPIDPNVGAAGGGNNGGGQYNNNGGGGGFGGGGNGQGGRGNRRRNGGGGGGFGGGGGGGGFGGGGGGGNFGGNGGGGFGGGGNGGG